LKLIKGRHYLDMKKQIAYVNEDAIVYIGENSYSGKAEIYVSGDEEDGLISIEASLSLPDLLKALGAEVVGAEAGWRD